MKRLLSSDPIGRKQVWWHDQGDRNYVIETKQDVEPIIELAQAEKNAHGDYQRFKGDKFHKIATVPTWMLFDTIKRRPLDDDELLARLRDPLFAKYRTHPGRV